MMLYEDMKKKILGKLGDYELVFVDDGSGDNSWEIMNEIRAMDPNVQCVKLSRNFGEHAALLAGLSVCTGDCAVTKQADLQEDSEIILEMYESWKKGNKVVLAVRASRDENAVKKFFANLYYFIVRKFVNKRMPVGGCDCYLLDRQVIEVLELLDEKNSSLTLQVLWAGFQTDEIYFHRKDREVGKSRWTFAKKFKLVMDSMMSFSYFPIRCMSTMGVLFFVLSVILMINVIVEKCTVGTPILGWASMMCVVLFSFGIMMLMMGILGEYVWRTLDASRNRPPYLIDVVKTAGAEETGAEKMHRGKRETEKPEKPETGKGSKKETIEKAEQNKSRRKR
jgi:dolichol-phosphate mannosyltransferase